MASSLRYRGPIRLHRKEFDIHQPSLGLIVRISDDGTEFFGTRVNIKSPALDVFHVDKDNWIITSDPLGGVELHSADAVARIHRENRGVNNAHTLELVRSKHV